MNVRQLIKNHEDLKLKAYRCPAGFWTIGYGRNLEQNGISEGEAEVLLSNDLHRVTRQCELKVTGFSDLDEVRKAVLIDIAINCGVNGLLLFRKMLNALWLRNYDRAADEVLDSNLAPNRAQTLAQMMRTGKWPQ